MTGFGRVAAVVGAAGLLALGACTARGAGTASDASSSSPPAVALNGTFDYINTDSGRRSEVWTITSDCSSRDACTATVSRMDPTDGRYFGVGSERSWKARLTAGRWTFSSPEKPSATVQCPTATSTSVIRSQTWSWDAVSLAGTFVNNLVTCAPAQSGQTISTFSVTDDFQHNFSLRRTR